MAGIVMDCVKTLRKKKWRRMRSFMMLNCLSMLTRWENGKMGHISIRDNALFKVNVNYSVDMSAWYLIGLRQAF